MISAKILLARQNVALTRPPDPQTFWMRKPCIGNPASAPRGAIYECAFAPYRRRGPQCSTGADGTSPDKYGDFAFRRRRLWFVIRPALIERPRAMKIVFTSRPSRATQTSGRKSTSTLRAIARPWIKRQAGKRL
jgi:hypothetical protein